MSYFSRLSLLTLLLLAAMTWSAESFAGQLTATWTDNSINEDGFKIERKQGQSGTFAEIATVGPNIISFTDSGLADGLIYCYQVRAYNVSGDSSYSNEDCGTATTVAAPTTSLISRHRWRRRTDPPPVP